VYEISGAARGAKEGGGGREREREREREGRIASEIAIIIRVMFGYP
jgi:hypothetical protein